MDTVSIYLSGSVLFGAALSLALAGLLWFRKSDHALANRYLASALAISTFFYTIYAIFLTSEPLGMAYPWLVLLAECAQMLVIPAYYFYMVYIYRHGEPNFKLKRWPHLIIPMIVVCAMVPVLASPMSQRNLMQAWFDQTYTEQFSPSTLVFVCALVAQQLIYFILMIKEDRRYTKTIKNIFSELESVKLYWLRGITMFIGLAIIINGFSLLAPTIAQDKVVEIFNILFFSVSTIFYFYVAVQAVYHPYLFSEKNLAAITEYAKSTASKYCDNPLPEKRATELKTQLLNHLKCERPYLDIELTLNQLANNLGLSSSKQLSQLLNQHLNESFFELINRYRVEEAKNMLQTASRKTMIDIAYESGFKSVSTFYSHFKKVTGMTPKEYTRNT